MRFKISIFLFIISLFVLSCGTSSNLKSITSGDVNLFLKGTPKAEDHPNAGADFLLSYMYVEYFADGTSVFRQLHRYKIFSERGHRYASVFIPYREGYQQAKILFANTIKPDGRVVPLNMKDVHDSSEYAAFDFYTDIKQKSFTMPAVENGCVVEYAYEVRNLKPLLTFDYYEIFLCQNELPMEEDILEVVLPAKMELKFKKFKTSLEPVITMHSDKRKYVITNIRQKEIIPEPRMPVLLDKETFSQIYLWTLGSWGDISRWYISLVKEQMQSDSELEAFTRQLIKDKKTDEEKIKAIFNFVSQKVRYVAVLLGPYTHKPHPASEIFKKRYGDCKDKTTLLLTMLKIAGIEGLPVLVPTRSESFDEAVPSLQVFNHVIAAVRSGNKYYWLDGTNEVAAFDSVPFTRPTIVFVINFDGTYSFVKTPPMDDNKDFSSLKLESNINRDGNADVNVTYYFSGKAAEWARYFYKYLSPKQRKNNFERRGVEVKELNFSSFTDTDKPFEISLKGIYKNMAQKMDENTMVLTNTVRLDSYRDITSAKERRYPISFMTSFNSKEKYTYTFPAGFKIKNMPKSFASVKSFTKRTEKYGFHDSTFEISIEKKEFEHKIKLGNLNDFKKYAAEVQDHEASVRNIFFDKK
ncbi:MAG TPA: DUF3857 and transglutaminase domain-containing protein [Syntrophales bacterium]|nr:DUF3857 and transglutaminase domain-containing protein [Syntrophales bacterium]